MEPRPVDIPAAVSGERRQAPLLAITATTHHHGNAPMKLRPPQSSFACTLALGISTVSIVLTGCFDPFETNVGTETDTDGATNDDSTSSSLDGDSSSTGPEPSCGNGIVDAGETCDDGNDDETDECTSLCAPPMCDDGIVSGDETDVDCGGSCDGCGEELECTDDEDCASSNCFDGGCAAECTPWTSQFGTAMSDSGGAIAVDGNGEIYIAGATAQGLEGNAHAGDNDMFLSKYSPDGTRAYTRQIGSPMSDNAYAIDVDGAGNILVAGWVGASFDGNTHHGDVDGGIAVYDLNTTKQWSRQLGTQQVDRIEAAGFTSNGQIYVAGMTTGSYGPHTNGGSGDLWLVKLDADGTELWSVQMSEGGIQIAYGLAVADNDDVILVGYAQGDFDGNTAQAGDEGIVVRFDSGGAKLWSNQIGGPGNDEFTRVALDPSGDILITGWTTGSFDGHSYAGELDVIVVRLDPDGAMQWSTQVGGSGNDHASGIAVDAEGTIYVTGNTEDGLGEVVPQGDNDLMLLALEPSGELRSVELLGTAEADVGRDVRCDAAGRVYVTGYSAGVLGDMSAGQIDIVAARVCGSD